MNCAKSHKLIGDWLDGVIAPADKDELEGHCAECADCRTLRDDFLRIVDDARNLPKAEPSARVWTNVLFGVREARREKAHREARQTGWLDRLLPAGRPRLAFGTALALVVVLAGGLLVLRPGANRGMAALSEDQKFTMAKLAEAETHSKLALKALGEAGAAESNGLDPATAAAFQKNLADIDVIIQACRKAVDANPSSIQARVYLLGAYMGKIEFLDNVITAKKKTAARGAADPIL